MNTSGEPWLQRGVLGIHGHMGCASTRARKCTRAAQAAEMQTVRQRTIDAHLLLPNTTKIKQLLKTLLSEGG